MRSWNLLQILQTLIFRWDFHFMLLFLYVFWEWTETLGMELETLQYIAFTENGQ